ncbi:MAG: type II toxin-antitoxin system MqsA family antitoxin [Ignavibacteriae bacterium]|nr:type II toxin-antitoxin system MqsA family antitoxin [Ignavibacteriota bacterium]
MKKKNINKSCLFCGNKNLSPKKVQYIYKHNGSFFVVDDVPCLQCDFCGEQYFEGPVLERIEKMYLQISNNMISPNQILNVPIENFANI